MARQSEQGRRLLIAKGDIPALRRFDRINRAEDVEVRDSPEACQVLDRLMRWAVFAETDRTWVRT
ncbi:hypothetical protein FHT77_006140 [Rhizobium sp. BK181]|nr:hypothetical protein [Rhizobium sp. BK181]